RAMEADSLCVIANVAIHQGRPADALAAAAAAQEISRSIGNTWGQASSALPLTLALLETGDTAGALRAAEDGARLARGEGLSPPMLVFSLARLGAAQRAAGSLDAAITTHEEALALCADPGMRWWFAEMIAAELCADYVRRGDWPAAAGYAERALAGNDGTLPFIALLFPELVKALARSGAVAHAAAVTRAFGQRARDNPRYHRAYKAARAEVERPVATNSLAAP
ncbi:MAG TPA: hypothetical protein VM536_14665, partial [Chloroflexia bacterium]|nr:hypothetical protein [Chloroflexia bacterium]